MKNTISIILYQVHRNLDVVVVAAAELMMM
jgi:hypothetical protein